MPMTLAQYRTIKELRKMVAKGEPFSRQTLALAHRTGYEKLADASSSTVAAYVNANLKSAVFVEALKPCYSFRP